MIKLKSNYRKVLKTKENTKTLWALILACTSSLFVTGCHSCWCYSKTTNSYAAPAAIIDAHTHLFNAKYLPIEGIAIAHAPISPPAAKALETIVLDMTGDSHLAENGLFVKSFTIPPGNSDRIASYAKMSGVESSSNFLQNVLAKKIGPDYEQRLLDTGKINNEELNALKSYVRNKTVTESTAKQEPPLSPEDVALAFHKIHFMADRNLSELADVSSGFWGDLDFLHIVTSSESDILSGLEKTYPNVDLFVHLMMDLENTYDEKPTFGFDLQVKKMLALQNGNPGKTLTFGAYDPFRRGNAFNFAVEQYAEGVIGFKFYPPDGYSPDMNCFPGTNITGTVLQQWEHRYDGIAPSDIDHTNEQFFAFCESNDIPIFVHCSPGGFEAVGGYGKLAANPTNWIPVLERHHNLRVCFGHSGGPAFWFGQTATANTKDESKFGEAVVELCGNYPNVYCDSAYWELILSKGGDRALAANLPKLIKKYPALSKKLVYGSDWFMISQLDNYGSYLETMLKALQNPKGEDPNTWQQFINDFFANNEARYLRLDKLAEKNPALRPLITKLSPNWQDGTYEKKSTR
jgi:predicted TIM-barrel fold metal-dependent hydrolase